MEKKSPTRDSTFFLRDRSGLSRVRDSRISTGLSKSFRGDRPGGLQRDVVNLVFKRLFTASDQFFCPKYIGGTDKGPVADFLENDFSVTSRTAARWC